MVEPWEFKTTSKETDMRARAGFTLIEIMLVVVIIAILAAMVGPRLSGRTKSAKITAATAEIEANITAALDLYELDNGQYPTTDQGLKALVQKPTSNPVPNNWNGPYLKKRQVPTDPWGNDYQYVSPGEKNEGDFDLFSLGPDGVESDDDIVNWVQ
jgi:general secretion pathway protein G